MTKEIKTMTFIGLLGALFISLGTTLVTGTSILPMNAICTHEGNHYTLLVPTKERSGVKEYWVCCKCHEHFFEKQANSVWVDAGTAPAITNSSDDRYISKLSSTARTGYTDNQGFTYSTDGKTITKYTAVSGVNEVTVPEGVTDIGTAFKGKTNITKVTLPETIEEIKPGAFEDCTKLETVNIGTNVSSIETTYKPNSFFAKYSNGAFEGCTKLQYLVIPASVEEIVPYTFRDVNPNCKLFCEVASRPSGWTINTPNSGDDWNVYSNSSSKPKLPTYWLGQWHYDANGVPVVGAK